MIKKPSFAIALYIAIYFCFCTNIFALQISENKYYLNLKWGQSYFKKPFSENQQDILKKFTSGTSIYDRKSNIGFSLGVGYKVNSRLSCYINIGSLKHSLYSEANIFELFNLRYVSSFLEVPNLDGIFDTHTEVKGLFTKHKIARAHVDFNMIVPFSGGIKFNMINTNIVKLAFSFTPGIAYLKSSAKLNFNIYEVSETIKQGPNIQDKLNDWIQNYESKNNEQQILPKNIFNAIKSFDVDFSKKMNELDYKIDFKKKWLGYLGCGLDLNYRIYHGVNFYTSYKVNFFYASDQFLQIQNIYQYNAKEIDQNNSLQNILGISKKSNLKEQKISWTSSSWIISHGFEFGINLYF